MAIGDPGVESFDRAFVKIQNSHIVAGLTPLFTLRQELVASSGFRDRGVGREDRKPFTRRKGRPHVCRDGDQRLRQHFFLR